MRDFSQLRFDSRLPWIASAAAALGLVTMAAAGSMNRAVPVAVALAASTTVLSVIAAESSATPTRRTFAAAVALGMFSWTALVGFLSFGPLLLPAVLTWALALRALERPRDARQVISAGFAFGGGISTIVLLVAGSR